MIEESEIGPEGQTDHVAHIPAIEEIRDFELPGDEGLRDRVRRSIERREAASGLVYLSTGGLFTLLLEFLSTISGLFYPPSDRDGGGKES